MRYQRHLSLPEIGIAGQERLKAARVLVVGAGGLGCPAALYLAAAGIGMLGLVDCDRVELSNLQRQVLFDTSDLGRPKAQAARERLLALNPEITVVAHVLTVHSGNASDVLKDYDIVVDGSDRLSTRYLINDTCVSLGKALVTAAIHRFEGQAMTYVPGWGPCYRCLFPKAPEDVAGSCSATGVLGVLPGILGALQASEAIKIATGMGTPLTGRVLTYDALELAFTELPVSRRTDCPVCGDNPIPLAPQDYGLPCDGETLSSARRLSALDLKDLIESKTDSGSRFILIDVREPDEFDVQHLHGSQNIPLGELEHRIAECIDDGTPVFLCRSGRRSLAACALALHAGIDSPAHLEGGLLAWAAEIDASFDVASH